MTDHHLRLLILEDDPGVTGLLEEAFKEMEELQYSRAAAAHWKRTYATQVEQAARFLSESEYDALLLDVGSGSPSGLPAFLRLQSQAPGIPSLALTNLQEEALGLSLVRQGAHDYLILEELDCIPLAHVLRCAVERNRLWQAFRSVSLTDDLTGLYNRRGFLQLAERDALLAKAFGHFVFLLLAQWTVFAPHERDPQVTDLLTIHLAEGLRELNTGAELLGRWDDRTLVMLGLAAGEDSAAKRILALGKGIVHLDRSLSSTPIHALRLGSHRADSSVFSLETALDSARRTLCENMLVADRPGRHV